MAFSKEDKIVIKALHQTKIFGVKRSLREFPEMGRLIGELKARLRKIDRTRKKNVLGKRLLWSRSIFSQSVMVSVGVSALGRTGKHFVETGLKLLVHSTGIVIIEKAAGALAAFGYLWRSREVSIKTKMEIIKTCIFSILLYACETWTLRKR